MAKRFAVRLAAAYFISLAMSTIKFTFFGISFSTPNPSFETWWTYIPSLLEFTFCGLIPI